MNFVDIAEQERQKQLRDANAIHHSADAAGVPGTGNEISNWLHNVAGGAGAKPVNPPGSPGWYRDQQAGFKDSLQNPGLDNGLYNNAMSAAERAQTQNNADIARYGQMAQGKGPQLGVAQIMAGQQQAANAQNALANSARGGMYNQAAMGQNAATLNEQSAMQAQLQAAKLREENRVAGLGMYTNAINAGRDASAGMLGNAQANAITGANQTLGYQNLQDRSELGLDNIALNTSRNNDNRANSVYSNYQNVYNENRLKQLGANAADREAAFAPWKTGMGIMGTVGGTVGRAMGGGG